LDRALGVSNCQASVFMQCSIGLKLNALNLKLLLGQSTVIEWNVKGSGLPPASGGSICLWITQATHRNIFHWKWMLRRKCSSVFKFWFLKLLCIGKMSNITCTIVSQIFQCIFMSFHFQPPIKYTIAYIYRIIYNKEPNRGSHIESAYKVANQADVLLHKWKYCLLKTLTNILSIDKLCWQNLVYFPGCRASDVGCSRFNFTRVCLSSKSDPDGPTQNGVGKLQRIAKL
jgi:hypothetical protein